MGRTSDARERILDSATALMQLRGYTNTSLEDILNRAGVQKGSFYHFFESKQALGLAVLDRHFAYPREHLFRVFEGDAPPLEQVERFFRGTCDRVRRTTEAQGGVVCGCPFGNIALEMSTMDEALRRKVAGIFKAFQDRFRAALRRAVERGELKPEADVDLLSARLVAYWEGAILLSKAHQDADLYAHLIEGAMAVLAPYRRPARVDG